MHTHTQVPHTHTSSRLWQMFGECTSLPCFPSHSFLTLLSPSPWYVLQHCLYIFMLGLPNLQYGTIDNLGQIMFLFYGGLSCALWDVQKHPWSLPIRYQQHPFPVRTSKHVSRCCQMSQNFLNLRITALWLSVSFFTK